MLQTQLSHGFPYSDRRSDYGGTIGVGSGGPGNRLHEHDPLALHQALQSSVDDGQNTGMDENATFMSDLPLLKSKFLILIANNAQGRRKNLNVEFKFMTLYKPKILFVIDNIF